MRVVWERNARVIKLKSRGWTVKVETEPRDNDGGGRPARVVNFAAMTEDMKSVVWAQPKDTQYIIGATNADAFAAFVRDHFDVVACYFAGLVPGSFL